MSVSLTLPGPWDPPAAAPPPAVAPPPAAAPDTAAGSPEAGSDAGSFGGLIFGLPPHPTNKSTNALNVMPATIVLRFIENILLTPAENENVVSLRKGQIFWDA